MLTKEEIQKLNSKELKEYTSLNKEEREIFSISFRSANENKVENRGRHKKDCDCEKCNEKRNLKNLLIQKTETEIQNEETKIETKTETVEISKPNIETGSETQKQIVETKNEIVDSAENKLQNELNAFKDSQKTISETQTTNSETKSEILKEEKKNQTVDLSEFISGALLLTGLDYFFPLVLKLLVGFVIPKYKYINEAGFEKLKLSESERKYLEPSAEMLCKYLFKDANPIVVFCFFAGSIYGGKFVMLNENHFDKPIKS